MKTEIHVLTYVYMCMCAHIYPSHPPEEVGEVGKVREGKGAGLKKDNIYLVKITTALSILSTTHSKLIRSPHFHEN